MVAASIARSRSERANTFGPIGPRSSCPERISDSGGRQASCACMTIARDALRRGDLNLAKIAGSIGCEPDTAFSLASKRMFGCSPGRCRNRIGAPEMLRDGRERPAS